MQTLSRMFGGAALVGAAMLSMTGAKADILLNFVRTQAGPSAGLTTFVYDVNLPVNSVLRTGDFMTFYDVAGLASASVNAANSRTSLFNITFQNVGVTPPTQTPPDDARFPNVTFTYTGTNFTGPTDQPPGSSPLAELFINSTNSAIFQNANFYSAQSFNNGTGAAAFNTTSVAGPGAVPEPGAVAMLVGMGVTGVGFLTRRRRK